MSPNSEHWVNMYTYIDAHLRYCQADGCSTETTIPDRREVLERVIRDVGDLHTASPAQLIRWLSRDGWAPKTRRTYHEHLMGYYRWAQRQGLIASNPMELVPRPRVPRRQPTGIADSHAAHVLEAAVEPWRTAAILAAGAGLRCCEIRRTRREDVTADRLRVLGKGGRVDELPTSPAIWAHIRGRRPGLLVRPALATQFTPHALSNQFAAYCRKQLGVDVHLHDLRRWYADALRRQGVDMEVIRQLMRHESLATTQGYFAPREEERRHAIQTLRLPASSLVAAA